MNKELTPLQAFENIIVDLTPHLKNANAEEIKIVENALKEKEKKIVGTTTVDKALEQFLIDSCPEVKKKLKALEIIKEKEVDIIILKISENLQQYNLKEEGRVPLTQEEYDLLKEIFQDKKENN